MTEPWQAAVERLDAMDREVTDFEAAVLETILSQRIWISPKQVEIVRRMVVRYLDDPALVAAVEQPQRLFVG